MQRPEWFIAAGISLQRAGRLEEAVAVLREGIAIWPTVPELRNSLGIFLGQLQRLDEAVVQYEESLRMRPAGAKPRGRSDAGTVGRAADQSR